MNFNPIICVDFDGVIHSYNSGWKGVDVIPDPPVDGAFNWLLQHTPEIGAFEELIPLPDGHPIAVIYSSRSKERRGIKAMKAWFITNGFPKDRIRLRSLEFVSKKPAAWLTIDDRAMCFEGSFPSSEWIKNFKPWNKKETEK